MSTALADIHVADQAKVTFSQATALTVKSTTARQLATDLFDAIRAFRKQAEGQKEETCRPLKTAWEDAKKPFDEFVKECQGHEQALQRKMAEWDREQERIAREEQARIQAKIDAQNAKRIEKAEAKGVEPVLKVAPVVQAPAKTSETQAGTKVTRTVKKVYTPTNLPTLMRDFPQIFDISIPKFNALAKSGILDGRDDVKVSEEYVYAQRS
jgi:Sec-independent protein translocase protein TatA